MSFDAILKDLAVKSHAAGAVMLASDGEIVASHTPGTGLEMDLIGAHHGIVLSAIKDASLYRQEADDVNSVQISTRTRHLLISTLKEGYYLVVVLERAHRPGRALFEARRAARLIEKEMG